ncbi:hypothetical protein FRC09_002633 [Ceratobasidium sp. 395]|nr:hypothetical protein FRC09_002633 [Ceratobasidium sp. 395]
MPSTTTPTTNDSTTSYTRNSFSVGLSARMPVQRVLSRAESVSGSGSCAPDQRACARLAPPHLAFLGQPSPSCGSYSRSSVLECGAHMWPSIAPSETQSIAWPGCSSSLVADSRTLRPALLAFLAAPLRRSHSSKSLSRLQLPSSPATASSFSSRFVRLENTSLSIVFTAIHGAQSLSQVGIRLNYRLSGFGALKIECPHLSLSRTLPRFGVPALDIRSPSEFLLKFRRRCSARIQRSQRLNQTPQLVSEPEETAARESSWIPERRDGWFDTRHVGTCRADSPGLASVPVVRPLHPLLWPSDMVTPQTDGDLGYVHMIPVCYDRSTNEDQLAYTDFAWSYIFARLDFPTIAQTR